MINASSMNKITSLNNEEKEFNLGTFTTRPNERDVVGSRDLYFIPMCKNSTLERYNFLRRIQFFRNNLRRLLNIVRLFIIKPLHI